MLPRAVLNKLPPEIWNIIYRMIHEMYMVDVRREIEHNVVWVRLRSGNNYRYSFTASKNINYLTW